MTAVALASPFFALPAQAQVGIQAGTPNFVIGTGAQDAPTIIGFGGKQWAVIGHNGAGVASEAGTLTLLLANGQTIGSNTPFRRGQANDPGDGTMSQEAVSTWWFDNNPGGTAGNPGWTTPNEYNGSTLQSAMDAAYGALPAKEQHLIASRTLTGGSANCCGAGYDADHIAGTAVGIASFWPLSVAEASQVNGTVRQFGGGWWLRSPGDVVTYAAFADFFGDVHGIGLNIYRLASSRPAFKPNLASVIFTSSVGANGKSAATVGAGLRSASAPMATGAVKLTVSESTLSLNSSATTVGSVKAGDTVNIAYTGATIGANNVVSAVIQNGSGTVLFYGKLASAAANADGTASFTVPAAAALPNGNYTIRLFVEEINGENETDFASVPIAISMTVANATPMSGSTASIPVLGPVGLGLLVLMLAGISGIRGQRSGIRKT